MVGLLGLVVIVHAIITGTAGGLSLSISIMSFEAILFVPTAILLAFGKPKRALIAAIPTFALSFLIPLAYALYLRCIWLGYPNADPSLADRYFTLDYLSANHPLAFISALIILVCAIIAIALSYRRSQPED